MVPQRLEFGIFMAPFHRRGENPTLALRRDLELIQRLDELGYDEAWIGEHHSGGWEIIASPRCSSPPPASARSASGWAQASSASRTTTRSMSRTASSWWTT